MIKTFIKTHILDYAVDKLIDNICDNLGIYPDMEIKIYIVTGGGYIYADVGEYILEIRRSFFTMLNETPRFKVITHIPPIVTKYIETEYHYKMSYQIDNNKIAKNILEYINTQETGFNTTIITHRSVSMSELRGIIHSKCKPIKI